MTANNLPTWHKTHIFEVGDVVSYADPVFWQDRGTVTAIGPTERGGDITVTWYRTHNKCEESARNLVVWY